MKGEINTSGTTDLLAKDIHFYDVIEKTPSLLKTGNGNKIGRLYFPESWIGKKVLCLLLEDPEKEE